MEIKPGSAADDADAGWAPSLATLAEFDDPEGTHWRRRGGKESLSTKVLAMHLRDVGNTIVYEYYGEDTRVLSESERTELLSRLLQDRIREQWEYISGYEYRNAAHGRLIVVVEGH